MIYSTGSQQCLLSLTSKESNRHGSDSAMAGSWKWRKFSRLFDAFFFTALYDAHSCAPASFYLLHFSTGVPPLLLEQAGPSTSKYCLL